jgi:hypothetical protein
VRIVTQLRRQKFAKCELLNWIFPGIGIEGILDGSIPGSYRGIWVFMDGVKSGAGADGDVTHDLGALFNIPPEVSGAMTGVFIGFSHVLKYRYKRKHLFRMFRKCYL